MFGCIPSPIDVRDYKLSAKKAGIVDFPASYEMERPKVKNQGYVQSCVAHVTSSILEYYAHNQVNLSTNFVYGIQKKLFNQTGEGMFPVQACQIATQYGDMLETDCSGNNEVPFCYDIADAAFSDPAKMVKAKVFSTESYYLCNNTDDIKFALINNRPVMFCLCWYETYDLDRDGVIHFKKNGNYGYHATYAYGYNEKGIMIQNSWGESFGLDGCFILPWADADLISEARVLIDKPNDDEVNALIKPKMANKQLKPLSKIINFFINIVKKKK